MEIPRGKGATSYKGCKQKSDEHELPSQSAHLRHLLGAHIQSAAQHTRVSLAEYGALNGLPRTSRTFQNLFKDLLGEAAALCAH